MNIDTAYHEQMQALVKCNCKKHASDVIGIWGKSSQAYESEEVEARAISLPINQFGLCYWG